MRLLFTLLAVSSAVADVAAAPARLARPVEEFQLVFLDGDDRAPVRQGADAAVMDIGRVVSRCWARRCASTVVQRRFRLRVDARSTAPRFARVHAFVQNDAPGHRVRLDGRPLTSVPMLVDALVPLGVAVVHVLEIEVPISEPPGLLAQNIVWFAESAR
jgi:hypothetical protein